jgi:hypothetical protein
MTHDHGNWPDTRGELSTDETNAAPIDPDRLAGMQQDFASSLSPEVTDR